MSLIVSPIVDVFEADERDDVAGGRLPSTGDAAELVEDVDVRRP